MPADRLRARDASSDAEGTADIGRLNAQGAFADVLHGAVLAVGAGGAAAGAAVGAKGKSAGKDRGRFAGPGMQV